MGPREQAVLPRSFLLRLEASGGAARVLNRLVGFGRACASARSHQVLCCYVGGVRAGLPVRAVSLWPFLLAYTLVD